MKTNMGSSDRIIRAIIAIAVVVLCLTKVVTGVAATILVIMAVIFLITGFIGFCPAYRLFGINTCRKSG